jgi:hypothetical protein
MTLVKFLINEIGDREYTKTVYAYFPQLKFNKSLYYNTMNTSYSHIGQHSACHIDYAKQSREATKQEYKDLYEELISIGYEVKILNKDK